MAFLGTSLVVPIPSIIGVVLSIGKTRLRRTRKACMHQNSTVDQVRLMDLFSTSPNSHDAGTSSFKTRAVPRAGRIIATGIKNVLYVVPREVFIAIIEIIVLHNGLSSTMPVNGIRRVHDRVTGRSLKKCACHTPGVEPCTSNNAPDHDL